MAMLATEGEEMSKFQQQQKSWPSLFIPVHGLGSPLKKYMKA
jgi:hypothetical protein